MIFNKFFFLSLMLLMGSSAFAQNNFKLKVNEKYGYLEAIQNVDDPHQMNFLIDPRTDHHHDYDKNRWGLGGTKIGVGKKTVLFDWRFPTDVQQQDGSITAVYQNQYLNISVKYQKQQDGTLRQSYAFTNRYDEPIKLSDVFLYTPFNDEYPNAETATSKRCNAHLWTGGDAAYVNAMRMGGEAPHLGMVVTQGHATGYDITGKVTSNERGIINLNFRGFDLQPKSSKTIEWTLFWHQGWDDFYAQAKNIGWVKASANQYNIPKGKKLEVTFEAPALKNASITIDGKAVKFKHRRGTYAIVTDKLAIGEHQVSLLWGENKSTWVNILVSSDFITLADRRLRFILDHQTDRDPKSWTHNAFIVYDMEDGEMVFSEQAKKYQNLDEGAERNGMGIAMAQMGRIEHKPEFIEGAEKYAHFVHQKLQKEDYTTFSDVHAHSFNRGYNYIFASNTFLETYKTTNNTMYLDWCLNTLYKFYTDFPGFYAIDIPCLDLLNLLKAAGRTTDYDRIFAFSRKQADKYAKNGVLVPEHEVNYEQTIIAPSVAFLCEFYLVSGEQKYLDAANQVMPALTSFNGFQPDFHLHDIAIRHWDGYWFGKRERWGDTFPHYWSAYTAHAFWVYALASGKPEFKQRALDIVQNNMCLIFENGGASCAYLYPDQINGQAGKFYDPYANDQDYAMVYFLRIYEAMNHETP